MKARTMCAAIAALCLGLTLVAAVPASALTPYDAPTISCGDAGLNELTINICGGASGAPAGVTLQWMPYDVWITTGWLDSSDPRLCALSLSGQPSLQHPGASRWDLGPGACEDILIGDINFDETGVSGTGCGVSPLDCGTRYVFRAFAHAGRGMGRSAWTDNVVCSTAPCPASQCTFTQGYWKNHGTGACQSGNNADAWPSSVRSGGMDLGTVHYSADQLCSIYNVSAGGNGLISLAHQLITAKMNLANGATSCPALTSAISSADALIGSKVVPPVGSGTASNGSTGTLTNTLDAYNNGSLCPGNCGDSKTLAKPATQVPQQRRSTWGTLKVIYR